MGPDCTTCAAACRREEVAVVHLVEVKTVPHVFCPDDGVVRAAQAKRIIADNNNKNVGWRQLPFLT